MYTYKSGCVFNTLEDIKNKNIVVMGLGLNGGGEACGHAGEWVYAGYDVWNVEVGKNGVAEKVHVKGLCQHCHGSSHCVG